MLRACLSLRKTCKGKSEAIKQIYFLVVETQCCLNPALHWEHLKCLFSWNLLLDLGTWQHQRNSTRVLGNFQPPVIIGKSLRRKWSREALCNHRFWSCFTGRNTSGYKSQWGKRIALHGTNSRGLPSPKWRYTCHSFPESREEPMSEISFYREKSNVHLALIVEQRNRSTSINQRGCLGNRVKNI